MEQETTDRIAREAARLLELGEVSSIRQAIKEAYTVLHISHEAEVRRPAASLVRQHVQGMAMQALGADGYAQSIQQVWETAEEVMTVLEEFNPVLAGRAAKGLIDAGVTLHIRVYTKKKIGELAEMLVAVGYEEPEFDTVDTRWGRLNRLQFEESDIQVIVTRCKLEMQKHLLQNLYKEEPIDTVNLKQLRNKLQELK